MAAFAAIALGGAVVYGRASHSSTVFPGGGETIVIKPRLGDRLFVASVLESVFGPNEEARLISNRPEVFGGSCDPYTRVRTAPGPKGFAGGEEDCGEQGTYQPTELNPSSVVRQGYLIRACESLTSRKKTLAHALGQLPGLEINRESLTAAYQLFFPERLPGEAVIESLANIPGVDATARWQSVLKILCIDPTWQVI